MAGQVGVLPDGTTAQGALEQCRAAFANLGRLLEGGGMSDSEIGVAWQVASDEQMTKVVKQVADQARAHGIEVKSLRHLMKRARLPRLGKALDQV